MSVSGQAVAISLLLAFLPCVHAAGDGLGSGTYYLGVERTNDSLPFGMTAGGFRLFTGYRLPGGFGLEGSYQAGVGPPNPMGPFSPASPFPRGDSESGMPLSVLAGPPLAHLNALVLPENSHASFLLRSGGIGLRYDEGAAHVSIRLTGSTPGITVNWGF